MKSIYNKLFKALFALVIFTACEEEDGGTDTGNTALEVQTVTDLAADPDKTGIPNYFSLKNNAVVDAADSLTDNWDIAFMSTNIYLNGGEATVVDGIFSELTEAPTSGYEADAVPKTWYDYSSTTHIITPIAGKLIVVKLADGTYAKIEVSSYYKGSPDLTDKTSSDVESRYYNFQFVYQFDGSTSFE